MTRRRVCFDGAVLAARPWTGVARAFLTTLDAYARRGHAECVLLVPGSVPPIELHGVRIETTRAVRGPVARQLSLPALLTALRADVLHAPVAAIPWHAPCPVVATVHDLPWRAAVSLGERGEGIRHRMAARLARRRAAAVVVPSNATRDALLADAAGRVCAPVHVVPHGVEPPATPADPAALIGPFVAFGDRRPRKNVERLLRAHRLARSQRSDLPDLRLLGPGLDWVDDETRVEVLRRARALCAVGLHEGFGLPVAEAFGHGVPVVCSTISSLPEVAGGAALTVDPTDEEAIAAALIRIHADEALRADLRTRGLARAAELTPEHSADGWRRVHDEVAR